MTSTTSAKKQKKRNSRGEKTPCGNSPRRGNSGRRMLILLLCLAVAIILFMVAIYPLMIVGAPSKATIKIPRNATVENVRDSLTRHFGKDYAANVMLAMKLRNTDFSTRYGAYEIQEGTSPFNVMRRLTGGGQTPVRITINGFRSLPLLTERIAAKMDFPADSLRKALADPEVMGKYGLTPDNAMALFLDDTYEVYWSATPRELIEKIGDNFLYVWNDSRVAKAKELGLTPAELTILSSIVDEETNNKDEKGTIGRLYINRLQSGMKLQADPTVRFALGDFTIKRVRQDDLKKDSPYNTYKYAGLPPGPIRTTSRSTINAILDSEPNNFRFMCAKEDFSGTHNFAASYDEHVRNAARYQAALDERGITR